MKYLFLDSNIFLNFYDFHDEDLDQLGKLVDLISGGEIQLFLTTQVCDEVKRNRDVRIREAYNKFANSKAAISMPVFCKHYDEYQSIRRAQNILDNLKSNLSKKLWKDIQEKKLKADKIIEDLFSVSTIIDSDAYLTVAIKRHRFGRPPGKKDRSYGDEINWEALLAGVLDEDGEFIVISEDGDYASAIDENSLKDYLVEEWSALHKNDIFLYKSLGRFFSEHDIKIELRIEQEKNELIRDLINSSNFLTTHDIVSKLNKYNSFTDDQLRGLSTALNENSQVRWIIKDQDINDFYTETILNRGDLFDPIDWDKIKKAIQGEDDMLNSDSELADLESKLDEQKALDMEEDSEDIPF